MARQISAFVASLAQPHRFFLVFGSIGILLLAILTPPYQVPDEQQHLLRAFSLSEFHVLPERQGPLAGGRVPRSLTVTSQDFLHLASAHAIAPLHAIPFSQTRQAFGRPLNANDRGFEEFPTVYFPTGYAPQVVGVWIGRALGLGPVGLLFAARLVNALACIAIVVLGLRLLPVGAAAGLFVVMTPTSLAQMGSASPDGLLISTGLVLAAFSLRAVMGLPSLMGSALSSLGVCLTKLAYMPLALSGAAGGARRSRIAHVVMAGLAGVILLVWLKLVSAGMVALAPGTDAPAQTRFVMAHPLVFFSAVARTLWLQAARYRIEAVGVLGWLDVVLPGWVYTLSPIAFVASVLAPNPKMSLPALTLAFWAVLAAACALLTFLAAYVAWCPVGSPVVFGIQGRYFVPLAPLLACGLAALLSRVEIDAVRKIAYPAMLVFLIAQAAAAVVAVVSAFGVFG